jgi:hypothetical protein
MSKSPDDAAAFEPPVSQPTNEALGRFAPIYAEEYEGFKIDFLEWLSRKGKNPFRGEGYADDTIKTTHYKIEKVYRWKWRESGEFTKEFTPEDAEAYIDTLVSETTLADREVRDFIKAIKRLFSWFDEARATDYEWDYSKIDQLKQQGTSKRRHYFEEYELSELYDAAVEYGSLRSYHSISPTERDQLKEHLSQRFGKPKGEVSPDDFDRANSWKFPSLIAISIDLGLRPIEIERASTKWLRPTDQKVVIPRDESSKGNNPWECVLSPRASRAVATNTRYQEGICSSARASVASEFRPNLVRVLASTDERTGNSTDKLLVPNCSCPIYQAVFEYDARNPGTDLHS